MLYSMTGYGKASITEDRWSIDCEIRSVNNRYLDLRIKLPGFLNYMESDIRNLIRKALVRGRVEVNLFCRLNREDTPPILHGERLKQLIRQVADIQRECGLSSEVPVGSLLAIEGVVETEDPEFDEDALRDAVLPVVDEAVEKLARMRGEEGERLGEDLLEKIRALEEERVSAAKRAPKLVEEEHARLRENVRRLLEDTPVDEDRLANEIAIYAQKADIDEELVRLGSHLVSFANTLKKGGAVGKKLDFVIQEMNREVNTMSSKSNDIELTELCVRAKAVIEQLREQIQNLE